MSEKKPPPRPPLPRQVQSPSKSKSGKGTASTPGRLRSALASISIRYNPATAGRKDSDSEEEICIVRKSEPILPNGEEADRTEIRNEENQNTVVTQNAFTTSSPEEPNSETPKQNTLAPKPSSRESNGCQDTVTVRNTEKRTVEKQKTWPTGSTDTRNGAESSGMRFLRREPGPAAKNDQPKASDAKEEVDSGSQPSKTHLSLHSDRGRDREHDRSRSPSPFGRLHRQPNQDTAERLTATTSAISLSSLLAAAAKEDTSEENESKNKEIEEQEEFQDALPELSPPSRVSNYEENDFQYSFYTREPPATTSGVVHEPSFTFISLGVLLTYTYLISTPPVFVSGMVFGFLVAYLVGCAVLWLFCPEDSVKERFERELSEYNLRVAQTPRSEHRYIDPGILLRPRELKGWMYKAHDYDPGTATDTTPVFVQLRGTKMSLSHPKLDNTGNKYDPRTVDDSGVHVAQFTHHDHFELAGGKVSLVPPTITRKRIWSKKYPICIMFEKPMAITEEVREVFTEDQGRPPLEKMRSQPSFEEISVLFLFARTGREKEEWHQHICKVVDSKQPVSDIDHLLRPSCSYPHYMAKLLPNPDESKQESQQLQMAWVNVLFGRMFWDVWQDQYWADKITQRFQNKLSKLHKPQFIRDIRITDLCLGHTLPLINRVSPPVLDERGTWVDFDVTYNGGLVFTLETHLNVEGYLSYFLNLGSDSKEVVGDLEMAELSRKLEMQEAEDAKEENDDEDNDDSLTSESPPESDSDFESPESDMEEFITKLADSRPTSSETESTSDLIPEILYTDPLQVKYIDSLSDKEGLEHNQEEGLLEASGISDQMSLESLKDAESIPEELNYVGRNSPVQKQSSSEETSEKPLLSQPHSPTERMSDSAPSSPARKSFNPHTGTKKKLFSVIERLAKSKWVKKAAETKIVKSAAEKFSNMPIILSVEVQTVKGTLTLNIPPPPTNRLWYGFRGNPMLFVSARPKLGARQVKLTHVTDWIEKKLKQEFRNMFVLPNMEDLPIKIMNCDMDKQFADN